MALNKRHLVALTCLLVISGFVLHKVNDSGGQESSTAAPPTGRVTTPSALRANPPTVEPELDHEDDYDAPVDELIGHLDHLDFDRLSPEKRAALEAEIARQNNVATDLWAVYGLSLTGRSSEPAPEAFAELSGDEVTYLIAAIRAEDLAEAVGKAGSLNAARANPIIGQDAPSFTVTVQSSPSGPCVQVAPAGDQYQRVFRAAITSDASAERNVTSTVRVATAAQPGCEGQPVSLSPQATDALLTVTTRPTGR